MKIGAKEMKNAYKQVKMDQIEVCKWSFEYWVLLLKCSVAIIKCFWPIGPAGSAGRYDGRCQWGPGSSQSQLWHTRNWWWWTGSR